MLFVFYLINAIKKNVVQLRSIHTAWLVRSHLNHEISKWKMVEMFWWNICDELYINSLNHNNTVLWTLPFIQIIAEIILRYYSKLQLFERGGVKKVCDVCWSQITNQECWQALQLLPTTTCFNKFHSTLYPAQLVKSEVFFCFLFFESLKTSEQWLCCSKSQDNCC